jgi:hypothetical protein
VDRGGERHAGLEVKGVAPGCRTRDWGVVGPSDPFRMFRRAKIWLDAVPDDVMGGACHQDLLIGRLRLTDDQGWPLCAAVRPPRIQWSAGSGSNPDGP